MKQLLIFLLLVRTANTFTASSVTNDEESRYTQGGCTEGCFYEAKKVNAEGKVGYVVTPHCHRADCRGGTPEWPTIFMKPEEFALFNKRIAHIAPTTRGESACSSLYYLALLQSLPST